MYFWKWKPQITNEANRREITFIETNTKEYDTIQDTTQDTTKVALGNSKEPIHFVSKEQTREKQNNHLLERGTMIQKSINPFLFSTNYIEDLETETRMLRPMNSNFQQ